MPLLTPFCVGFGVLGMWLVVRLHRCVLIWVRSVLYPLRLRVCLAIIIHQLSDLRRFGLSGTCRFLLFLRFRGPAPTYQNDFGLIGVSWRFFL